VVMYVDNEEKSGGQGALRTISDPRELILHQAENRRDEQGGNCLEPKEKRDSFRL